MLSLLKEVSVVLTIHLIALTHILRSNLFRLSVTLGRMSTPMKIIWAFPIVISTLGSKVRFLLKIFVQDRLLQNLSLIHPIAQVIVDRNR